MDEMIEEYEVRHTEQHELIEGEVNDGVGLTLRDSQFIDEFNAWFDSQFRGEVV